MRVQLRTLPVLAVALVALLAVAVPTASAKAWTWKKTGALRGIGGSADAIECPSTTLCVVAASNKVYTTHAPGSGTGWTAAVVVPAQTEIGSDILDDLSCPTATLCVAGDDQSQVVTSTNPSGGAAAWTRSPLPSGTYVGVRALSCASITFCGILDVAGLGLTTATPAGFGSSWQAGRVTATQSASLYDLSCAGVTCAGVESDGNVYSTTNAAGVPTWKATRIAKKPLNTIACAAPATCIAGGYGNVLHVTGSPTGAAKAWSSIALAKASGIDHTYCRTPRQCFALSGGVIYASAAPAKAKSWVASKPLSGTILSDMSCPTAKLCVAINVGGDVFVGRR